MNSIKQWARAASAACQARAGLGAFTDQPGFGFCHQREHAEDEIVVCGGSVHDAVCHVLHSDFAFVAGGDDVDEVTEVPPSRALDGVISFDIGRDVAEPDVFIAIEVFEDRNALDRQESLPEVARALGVLEQFLAAEPEATIFHVSSSEPWGD